MTVTGARIRKLMLGVAGLAIVAGIVVAITTAPSSDGPLSPPSPHGVSKAMSAERLSETEQDRRLAKIFKRLRKEIHRHEGITVGPRDRATAARYLGLDVSEIRAALRSGRSLAQLASATRGRSPADLIGALIRAKTATLAAEARAGKLSRAAHSAALATLAQLMRKEVYFSPRARSAGSR